MDLCVTVVGIRAGLEQVCQCGKVVVENSGDQRVVNIGTPLIPLPMTLG